MIERHERVQAIVTRHGGFYDGGESGCLIRALASRSGRPTLHLTHNPSSQWRVA